MPNKNYLSGRRFEYEVMDDLKTKGYKVIRASGSHGEFDVIGYKPHSTIMVQCKVVETLASAQRLINNWEPPNPPSQMTFTQEIRVKVKGTGETYSWSA